MKNKTKLSTMVLILPMAFILQKNIIEQVTEQVTEQVKVI